MCTTDVPLVDLRDLKKAPDLHCRLGDFSSGWDPYTADHLYTKGPSPGEQTGEQATKRLLGMLLRLHAAQFATLLFSVLRILVTDEYAPPESFIGRNWVAFDKSKPQSYDSWSIGVTALELLLGSPNVFSVDQRTNALLTSKMKRAGASEEEISHALCKWWYLACELFVVKSRNQLTRRNADLAALSHFCIYVPSNNPSKTQSWPLRDGDPLYQTAMVKESCTLQDFHRALRARDPLGLGFSGNDLLLHLIWQLLAWDTDDRMTAEEALRHPYFMSPDGTLESLNLIAGTHNALESQMLDPRMDFRIEDDVEDFVCPRCGRTFQDWKSCQQHSNLRKHAKFCTYDRSNLPTCINAHSMLPAHPTSGYVVMDAYNKNCATAFRSSLTSSLILPSHCSDVS
jgi:serine/threonine protein kinase